MPNDKQEQALFSVEQLSKPSKPSKSSKSVGGIVPKVDDKASKSQPLAARMRPRNLDEFVGQAHIVGPGKLLRRLIEADQIHSMIFYGPPGTGKTTLAQIIANQTKSAFRQLMAVDTNIKAIRDLLKEAKERLETNGATTTVFIDEIHHLNKDQQDVLLPDAESGVIKLIGATTEPTSRSVNSALVSRKHTFELMPLSETDLIDLLNRALKDSERGLGNLKISADEDALRHLAIISDGDARKALNALELAATTTPPDADGTIRINLAVAEQSIQRKMVVYDKKGQHHFDAISAYQKAMRGSDVDAALYWLAKMIHAGEDPHVIARRLCVSASEDVGMANSMALLVAFAAWEAVDRIGLPEAKIHLAHATICVATSPKSFSAPVAIDAALADVENNRTQPMPDNIHDKHSPGTGKNFLYKHPKNVPGHFIAQDYLGANTTFYTSSELGAEKGMQEKVENWRKQFQEVRRQAAVPAVSGKPVTLGKCSDCHYAIPAYAEDFECSSKNNSLANKRVKPDFSCDCFELVKKS